MYRRHKNRKPSETRRLRLLRHCRRVATSVNVVERGLRFLWRRYIYSKMKMPHTGALTISSGSTSIGSSYQTNGSSKTSKIWWSTTGVPMGTRFLFPKVFGIFRKVFRENSGCHKRVTYRVGSVVGTSTTHKCLLMAIVILSSVGLRKQWRVGKRRIRKGTLQLQNCEGTIWERRKDSGCTCNQNIYTVSW